MQQRFVRDRQPEAKHEGASAEVEHGGEGAGIHPMSRHAVHCVHVAANHHPLALRLGGRIDVSHPQSARAEVQAEPQGVAREAHLHHLAGRPTGSATLPGATMTHLQRAAGIILDAARPSFTAAQITRGHARVTS